MLAKVDSFSNFGSLNPNLTWVFTYGNSVANFRAARYRKIRNTEAMDRNQWQIRIQRPEITV